MQSDLTISAINDPIDLLPLATSIRSSSNFRFAWQFYSLQADDLRSYSTIAGSLDLIIRRSDLHAFLANSMDDIYPREFTIRPLHTHASIVYDNGYFLDVMARASLDRLGAYSRNLSPATPAERETVNRIFASQGRFRAFHTQRGDHPDCSQCRRGDTDLISNWFFDVAWDYTFLLTWPEASLLWMGCLTDTD